MLWSFIKSTNLARHVRGSIVESTAAEAPVEFPSASQAVTDAVAVVWFMVTPPCSLPVLGSASNWSRRGHTSSASEATTVVSYLRVARDSDFTTWHIQHTAEGGKAEDVR